MTQKALVNNARHIRKAELHDAPLRAIDPQLAKIALNKLPSTNQRQ